MSNIDEQYLRRAIRLAMTGRGRVEPNPMVGCVLVKDGRIIGEGYHTHFGGPHAEPTALASCTESPAGATAYVTLEPCCHTNKKTPPCAPRLIEAKIARVVIGCLDPNPLVNGNGIRMLQKAGIAVEFPVLEAECRQLMSPYFAVWKEVRPYVTMKWAESADGKIAGPGGARTQISNPISSRIVHELRGRCDAIAVGIGTVLADDPELTVRDVEPLRIPERIVLDSALRIPLNSRIVQTAGKYPTKIYCTVEGLRGNLAKVQALDDLRVCVLETSANDAGRLQLGPLLRSLKTEAGPLGANLLVEAGPKLAGAMFLYGLVDRLWVIRSPILFEDDTAPAAAIIPPHFQKAGEVQLGNDVLTEYLNTRSQVFFDLSPSADLILSDAQRSLI